MNLARNIFFFFIVNVFSFSGVVQAEDVFPFPIETLKAALAEKTISQGPEASMLTRSPWGPGMYQQTVDAVVLLYVPGEVEGEWMMGSGVLVTAAGHIITNWHVVQNASAAYVRFRAQGPKPLKKDFWVAEVLATYPEKDLAFLELTQSLGGLTVFPRFPIVPLEKPDNIQVGQDVFTIGHPVGLNWTYTEGVISQIRPRYFWEIDGREFRATVLQTNSDVSFGSSGGPLINSQGKLVGIVSNITPGQAGFNFAISAHEIYELASQAQQKDTEQQEMKGSSGGMPGTQAVKLPEPSVQEKPLNSEQEYLVMVETTIDEKWITPLLRVDNPAVLKFRIAKSGEISNIRVDQSSGSQFYDWTAWRAVNSANPFPPFPADVPKEQLDVTYPFVRK